MPHSPIERKFSAGLSVLAALATAALVLHLASACSGTESAPAEAGSSEPPRLGPAAPGIDHTALSPGAVVVGDAQTVEASIAAYEH